MMNRFQDRREAGQILAQLLPEYRRASDTLVFALPRGGVPVGFEIARRLDVPLDVFVIRKLGAPGHEELALGAIAGGGVRVLNENVVQTFDLSDQDIDQIEQRERTELRRRESAYRAGRAPLAVRGFAVILVDDGLATGATMRAAVAALRKMGAKKIVVAVPVGAAATCRTLAELADELVCPMQLEEFQAIGMHYENFDQVSDQEVIDLLHRAKGVNESAKEDLVTRG